VFIRVLPAIIANSQEELDDMLSRLAGNVEWVMLDFIDGRFVASKSLMFDMRLKPVFKYEAHLMVENPSDYLNQLRGRVQLVIIHIESDGFDKAVAEAKALGFEVAIAINPGTGLDELKTHLKEVDRVLVMTVEPGSYGAPFVIGALEKVKCLRSFAPNLPIEVDGAMNPENAGKAREAGANIFASGSYIMKSQDIQRALKTLKEAIR
jgi:ribulose-phosphate 3-epimerase